MPDMSRGNVEIVRRVVEALRVGDYDRAASDFDPDAEWHNTDMFPGRRGLLVGLHSWGTGK